MKITDIELCNSLKKIINDYLIANNISYDTNIDENKTLILHIKPDSINLIMHNKGNYNGFVAKKT